MADFINTVDVIGDDALTDIIIDRSITEYRDNTVVTIGQYAFHKCTALTTANFPVATSIGNSAFNGCTALTTADFPAATSIGSSAFYNCTALTTADFPAATSIDDSYAFHKCTALTTANFPVATSIGNSALRECTALTTADFPAATSIGSAAFLSCSKLTTLILRNTNGVVKLSSTNALLNTPIASGTGYIYVPRALLSDDDATKDYRRATNWSTYAAQFRAIEDYPEITGG